MKLINKFLLALGLAVCVQAALAHGDVTPQAVDVHTLPQLGAEWREDNPYRKDRKSTRLNSSHT